MPLALIKEQTNVKKLFSLILFMISMYHISHYNFVLFHTVIEVFCILVAFNMFVLSKNTYNLNSNFYIIFIGIAYGYIAILDFMHMISFEGVNILINESPNISAQFWISARLMECISLVIACSLIKKRYKKNLKFIVGVYSIITTLIILGIYIWEVFPQSYVQGTGITLFRVMTEVIILLLLTLSLFILTKHRTFVDTKTYTYIKLSIILTLLSEILIVFYVGIHNTCFFLGNTVKLLSFYYLYKSIVQTGLKAPYEKLKQSEARYRKLIEASPDGIMIFNDTKVLYENKSFRDIFDIPKEARSDELSNYFPLDLVEITRQKYQSLKNINSADTLELRKINVNNIEVSIEIVTTLIEFDEELAILIIVRDINERVRFHELEKNRQALEQSQLYDKMKTEFISNLTHDLRTPLNIILGTTQLMNANNQEVGTLPYSKLNKYIYMIKQNSYRLLKLINNLIDLTKLDDKSLTMNFKNYNIVDVIENITLSVANYVESKGIELTFDTTIEEKIISCDADLIERVMLYLISNAVKFTSKEGKININIFEEIDNTVITVEDTGIGIPVDVKEKIFDRFRQLDTPLHRMHVGSGIGLSLVKSIIEEHNGTISIESQLGVGSIFTIKLPNEQVLNNDQAFEEVAITSNTNIEKISIEFSDIYNSYKDNYKE